jgi:hydrogenase nickel insertion protein HypA
MHEYSLVQSLVERAEDEAHKRSATAIHKLSVSIGAQAGVDVDLFKTAFMTFRERTMCEHADLEVSIVPLQWECVACGRTIEPGTPLHCPRCLRPARLRTGDEIMLDRIEMEVA